jgi:hypothetical protein
MKTKPQIRPVPSPATLKAIDLSGRKLSDYAKATPMLSTDTVSPLVQLLRKPKV